MTAIPERGETPFGEAGDGVVLRFTNSDLKRIEVEFGANWFDDLIGTAQTSMPTVATMESYIKHGAKKDGKPFEVPEEAFDKMTLMHLGEKILDAACQSMKGCDHKKYIGDALQAYLDTIKDGDVPSPLSPDSTSSTTSDEKASGPESQ